MQPNDIWKKGIPLSEAIYRFGNKEVLSQLSDLQQQGSFGNIFTTIAQKLESGKPSGDVITNSLKEASTPLKDAKDLKAKIQKAIIVDIRDRKVLAYGYSFPRQADAQAQEVPDDLWAIKSDWMDDTLKANGLQMDAIRLTPVKWITETPDAAIITTPKGRPSRKDQIIFAFQALDKDGKINRSQSMNSQCPMIRDWVLKHYPDDKETKTGLSDQNIRKTISPLFNKEK
ncbi:hypothetical protein [Sneathiella sp.]|jgi:hypothetical protein|uniref:hypothetical protein n=1 Tax=Sneathiella sp. TaxID=1964365 RepID=UPI0039E50255